MPSSPNVHVYDFKSVCNRVNILFFVDSSQFITFTVVKLLQLENILFILVTLLVSKLLKSKVVKLLQL